MFATKRLGVMGLPVDLASAASAVDWTRDIPDGAGEARLESRLDARTVEALDVVFGVTAADEGGPPPGF
jgi:hypothetical protein